MPDRASEVRWQTLQSLRKEGVRLTGEGTRRQFRSRKPFSAICTLEQRVSAKSPTRQSPSTGPPHGQHSSTEAPKSESPVRESFWPTLRRHILGKTNTTRPVRASCPICLDDVSIAGLPPPQMDDPDGKDGARGSDGRRGADVPRVPAAAVMSAVRHDYEAGDGAAGPERTSIVGGGAADDPRGRALRGPLRAVRVARAVDAAGVERAVAGGRGAARGRVRAVPVHDARRAGGCAARAERRGRPGRVPDGAGGRVR
ncbi:hypothetical protein AK830_g3918 [Neonectria ditissima]|uniref:Uncharacterized protein n=1 Tax=Neonectria ditissima TaxID=78410 RepID=A0A0P7BAF6_9HYPO|nr:hypothetical protein AK830_g3918 [Neonectria ditissima]